MAKTLAWIAVLGILMGGTYWAAEACKPMAKPAEDYGKGLEVAKRRAEISSNSFNMAQLKSAVQSYSAQHGKFPASLDELVQTGIITQVPPGAWSYDPNTGEVSGG